MYPTKESLLVIRTIGRIQHARCPRAVWNNVVLAKLGHEPGVRKALKAIKCDRLMLLNQIRKFSWAASAVKNYLDSSNHFSKRQLFANKLFANCTCILC